VPSFSGCVSVLDGPTRARMTGVSWRPECPVGLDDLRAVELDHWDFDGVVRCGRLVVHADHADAVVSAFAALFAARFPITSMRPIDDFNGDDDASMAANNTSGFNCRPVAEEGRWSEHAYGLAIDVNPVQNPYLPRSGAILPPAAAAYLDRSADEPGMIHADGPVVRAFAAIGWTWGGRWEGLKDYHHFSANGR
jgi:hypothetical protein